MIELRIYTDTQDRAPFADWVEGLRDVRARAIIRARLAKVQTGNLGDCKALRDGVQELRVDYGTRVPGVPEPPGAGGGVAAVWHRQERPGPRHQAGDCVPERLEAKG